MSAYRPRDPLWPFVPVTCAPMPCVLATVVRQCPRHLCLQVTHTQAWLQQTELGPPVCIPSSPSPSLSSFLLCRSSLSRPLLQWMAWPLGADWSSRWPATSESVVRPWCPLFVSVVRRWCTVSLFPGVLPCGSSTLKVSCPSLAACCALLLYMYVLFPGFLVFLFLPPTGSSAQLALPETSLAIIPG